MAARQPGVLACYLASEGCACQVAASRHGAVVSPRMPKDLGYQGQKLWKSVTDEFVLDTEPHKLRILADCCKLADAIDRLDKEADNAPLIAQGSCGLSDHQRCASRGHERSRPPRL